MEEYGANLNQPPVYVRHAELERYSEESDYRSVCPTCKKGLLLVRRDHETLELTAVDNCTRCAQTVVYEDAAIAGEPVQPLPEKTKEALRTWGRKQN